MYVRVRMLHLNKRACRSIESVWISWFSNWCEDWNKFLTCQFHKKGLRTRVEVCLRNLVCLLAYVICTLGCYFIPSIIAKISKYNCLNISLWTLWICSYKSVQKFYRFLKTTTKIYLCTRSICTWLYRGILSLHCVGRFVESASFFASSLRKGTQSRKRFGRSQKLRVRLSLLMWCTRRQIFLQSCDDKMLKSDWSFMAEMCLRRLRLVLLSAWFEQENVLDEHQKRRNLLNPNMDVHLYFRLPWLNANHLHFRYPYTARRNTWNELLSSLRTILCSTMHCEQQNVKSQSFAKLYSWQGNFQYIYFVLRVCALKFVPRSLSRFSSFCQPAGFQPAGPCN